MFGLVGSLLGSVASGLFGMAGQNSANKASEEMAANRYQTATADMTKAGLNPAAMFGSGSASPMPNIQNTMAAPAAAMKDAASSATQQLIAQKTIDQLTEQIAKTNADTANVRAGTPGIAARSSIASREAGAIGAIPDRVYIPIVQGGYGADKLARTGQLGSIAGAGAASAKSVASGVVSLGPSGPAVSSAVGSLRELKQAWDRKSPALFDAVSNWWSRTHANQTVYKNSR